MNKKYKCQQQGNLFDRGGRVGARQWHLKNFLIPATPEPSTHHSPPDRFTNLVHTLFSLSKKISTRTENIRDTLENISDLFRRA